MTAEKFIAERVAEIEGRRGHCVSDMDNYGHITAAYDKATEAQKDLPKLLKELWAAIKDRDSDAADAVLQRLESLSETVTALWAQFAAECSRAYEG